MRAVDRTDWALSLEFGGGAQQNGAVACWHGRSVEISRVEARDVGSVLAVLDEVAERLDSKGVRQWPRRFQPSWVTPAIEEGHTWLVHLDGELAATITLEWADPMWGPDDGSAGYVHRLAVRRGASGLGLHLLRWAASEVCQRERSLLRLDCVTSNPMLRSYYESAGFQHGGDVEVGGAPGQRDTAAPLTLISRYQVDARTLATATTDLVP